MLGISSALYKFNNKNNRAMKNDNGYFCCLSNRIIVFVKLYTCELIGQIDPQMPADAEKAVWTGISKDRGAPWCCPVLQSLKI